MTDTELLDWIIFFSATVICSRDGEDCWVTWYSSDEEAGDAGGCTTEHFGDAREAIRAAIAIESGDSLLTEGHAKERAQ